MQIVNLGSVWIKNYKRTSMEILVRFVKDRYTYVFYHKIYIIKSDITLLFAQ